MKKSQKFNFLDWNNKILLDSLRKIDLNIIWMVILDAVFYFLSGYLFIFWLQRIQEKMAAFNLPQDVISLGYEKTQQLVSEAKSFYYLLIFSFILLLITIIFLASIIKGIIWAKTTKTKITFAFISKFLVLNLMWMPFWFALIILISIFVEPALAPSFMLASIILALYFTNTLYTIFIETKSLKSIFGALKLNFARIHLFLLPYTIIFLLFYIIVMAGNLLNFNYSQFIVGIAVLFYAAAVRYYASTLVLEIKGIKPKV